MWHFFQEKSLQELWSGEDQRSIAQPCPPHIDTDTGLIIRFSGINTYSPWDFPGLSISVKNINFWKCFLSFLNASESSYLMEELAYWFLILALYSLCTILKIKAA